MGRRVIACKTEPRQNQYITAPYIHSAKQNGDKSLVFGQIKRRAKVTCDHPAMGRGKSIQLFVHLVIFIAASLAAGIPQAEAVRLKDIASIKGIRTKQLVGYGLVVGLNGSGDKSGAEFTAKAMANMLKKMGIEVVQADLQVKNAAAVMVTAELPPFARNGSRIDVILSSIGDAKSLAGGTLLLTTLKGTDGEIYALAQGPLTIGDTGTKGAIKKHLLSARISGGASVERESKMRLQNKQRFTMVLYNPDFTTIMRVSHKINGTFGDNTANPIDAGALELYLPSYMNGKVSEFISKIEKLTVNPDSVARVVINEKTGTVIIGDNVTLSTVAISHGNLTITVTESEEVYQPNPYGKGDTVVAKIEKDADAEPKAQVMMLPKSSTLRDLVKALNAIGAAPQDIISIFQSIKAAGALQAELIII